MLEEIEPFYPASFFQYNFSLVQKESLPKDPYKDPYLLPDFSDLLLEESFAEIAMCFSKEGIFCKARINKAFEDVSFPKVQNGDALELFFDTRDFKKTATTTKFCHHFVFFPKEVGERFALEISKFRAEDSHELCDPRLLSCETTFHKSYYEMEIFIDKEALFGFDPKEYDRLGFSYRVNRKKGSPQHFTRSSFEASIERFPALWASLSLK